MYGIFLRRKMTSVDLAAGRSQRRYAVSALAMPGSSGSSISTLVFWPPHGQGAAPPVHITQPECTDFSCPQAIMASSNRIAKSRFPGGFDRETERTILCTSAQGSVRGGRSSMRYRGAITRLARSVVDLPVTCRNRRKARSELQVSATVRFETRVASLCTQTSTSDTVDCLTLFFACRNWTRNPSAVSTSRTIVLFRNTIVGSSTGGTHLSEAAVPVADYGRATVGVTHPLPSTRYRDP